MSAPGNCADLTDDQIRDWESGELLRRRSPRKRWAAVDLATRALAGDGTARCEIARLRTPNS